MRPVTLVDGLRAAVPDGVRVETLDDWRDRGEVDALAAGADVVVLALGLGPASKASRSIASATT